MATYGLSKIVQKMSNSILHNMQQCCESSCNLASCWKWDIPQIINAVLRKQIKYSILVLNRPVTQRQEFIKDLWNDAEVRVTVDGGTNQWDKYLNTMTVEVQESMKKPDLITGDFDSITQEVLEKYKKKGCQAVHTPDQDHTDFTKSLIELSTHCQQNNTEINHVIAISQSSGRIDQILGNIQTLFLAKKHSLLPSSTELYLMSDDSLSWLLSPGTHVITIPSETLGHARSWCSLVPIGETCQCITTNGLKWDLDNAQLKYGELVSTSNTFNGVDKVKVKCSHTILWSMRLPSLVDNNL